MTVLSPRGLLPGMVILLAALAVAQESCSACDEPVFRYALSSWEADAYRLTVYKGAALDPSAKEALAFLEKASFKKGGKANFLLRVVEGPPPSTGDAAPSSQAPWMVLTYPAPADRVAWSGPLTPGNARALVDSPARRELAELLLDGESVPWILVESGRKDLDEKAASFLEKELARIPERLREETARAALPGEEPREVKVTFPLYRIQRDDPRERIFLSLLLHVKDGLPRKAAGAPLIFPLFGKGRILEVLTGPDPSPEAVLKACRFLAGPCACEVKGMAPGLDMLFDAQWEKADVQPLLTEIDLPPLTGLPSPGAPPPEEKGVEEERSAPPAPGKGPTPREVSAGTGGGTPAGGKSGGKASGRPGPSSLPDGFRRIVWITLAVLAAALGGLAVFFLRSKEGGS